jgi:hypothetical protein
MSDLEARIKRLEDRQELSDLAARYCIAVDDRDMDTIVDIFTPDGQMGHMDSSAGGAGTAGLIAYYEERLKGVGATYHYPLAQLIEFDSDDEAHGVTMANAEMSIGDQVIVGAIRYNDTYVRVEGRWRFRRRALQFLYLMDMNDLPTHYKERDRKRWPGPPTAAEIPDSLPTYQAFRSRVG